MFMHRISDLVDEIVWILVVVIVSESNFNFSFHLIAKNYQIFVIVFIIITKIILFLSMKIVVFFFDKKHW